MNTNYYPSAKIICDERTEGRTDGHADYYMAALRGHNNQTILALMLMHIGINVRNA